MIVRFSVLVLFKRKVLRWAPERARPEVARWHIGDEIGGRYCWDAGPFRGLNNAGRIVFSTSEGLHEIALWRGRNNSLGRRREHEELQRRNARIENSLVRNTQPQPVDWRGASAEPNYTPGQWIN